MKKAIRVILSFCLILSLVFSFVSVSAEQTGGVLFLHEGDYVTSLNVPAGTAYSHNEFPSFVPEGKYFAGWYDGEGNETNTVTVPLNFPYEAHLYAKFIDCISDGFSVDYSGIEAKPQLKGVAYINDGVYSASVNENGWALSVWSAEDGGAVIGRAFTGSAYAFEPAEKKTTTQVAAKHNGYLNSTADLPVGTVTELGWSAYSNFILRDKDGYAIVPKENTTYAVTITYEVIEEGDFTLFLCGDRKKSKINTGANAFSYSNYSDNYASAGLRLKGVKAGEQRTYTYYLTTTTFENSVPMLSLHCHAASFMAERVESAKGSDGKDYTSYTVDGKTYYPYKIVSTPRAVIRQVAVNQVEEGNVVVNFQSSSNGVEYCSAIVDGAPGTPFPEIENNTATPLLWYSDKSCRKLVNSKVFPANNATYYSISCLADNIEAFTDSSLYFGAKEKAVNKDGQSVKAFAFDSHTGGVIRVGDSAEGHTYKLSFSVMASGIEDALRINIATALPWNSALLKNSASGKEYVIDKDNLKSQVWYSFDCYFTADPIDTNLDETETGLNYNTFNNRSNAVFMLLSTPAQGEVYLTDITLDDLGNIIESGGAAALTEEAEKTAGSQAMRFFFSYKTNDGSDIIVADKAFKVIERGFIYRNGFLPFEGQEETDFNGVKAKIKTFKNKDFNTCWAFDQQTGEITFSTYIKGLNLKDTRKAEVKAYVVFEDQNGETHIIESCGVNRSLSGVQNGDTDPNKRVLVWGEEFNHYDSVTQVDTFTQKYDTMIPEDSSLSITTSEDNYFIDSKTGELVLRVTSDGNKNYTTAKSVTTRDIMVYKYGYLEMRAKVPFKKGMWPSFWLRPDTALWNKATYSGEIDIFEVSADNSFSTGLHKWYRNDDGTFSNSAISGRGNILEGALRYSFDNTDIANEYHIYGFEWTPDYMAFYVDNRLYCKIDITDETGEYDQNVPGMDCFRSYYYICLNNWVFTDSEQYWMPDRAETLPDFAQDGIDYRIDYIRLYQNKNEYLYNY